MGINILFWTWTNNFSNNLWCENLSNKIIPSVFTHPESVSARLQHLDTNAPLHCILLLLLPPSVLVFGGDLYLERGLVSIFTSPEGFRFPSTGGSNICLGLRWGEASVHQCGKAEPSRGGCGGGGQERKSGVNELECVCRIQGGGASPTRLLEPWVWVN